MEQNQLDVFLITQCLFNAAAGKTYYDYLLAQADSAPEVANTLAQSALFESYYSATLSNTAFAQKYIDQLVADDLTAANRAFAVDYVAGLLESGMGRGETMLSVATTLYGLAADDADWGTSVTKLHNQIEMSRYYTLDKQGDATDTSVLQAVTAGIDASTSLADAKAIFDDDISARIVNGYISQAQVVYDINGVSADDMQVTSDDLGRFTLPEVSGFANLVVTGGVDISTALPFEITYKAPAGATVVNAVTTLVATLTNSSNGIFLDDAIDLIRDQFAIPSSIDVLDYNAVSQAVESGASEDAVRQALQVYAVDEKVNIVVSQIAALLDGSGICASESLAAEFAFNAYADLLFSATTLPLTLTADDISGLINTAAASAGANTFQLAVVGDYAANAGKIVFGLCAKVDSLVAGYDPFAQGFLGLPVHDAMDVLTDIASLKLYAETVEDKLEAAVSPVDLTDFLDLVDSDTVDSAVDSGTAAVADVDGNGVEDNPGAVLSFAAATLAEAEANDGSITETLLIDLANAQFSGVDGQIFTSATLTGAIPTGLTAVFSQISSSQLQLAFTGTATANESADSVSGLSLQLDEDAFTEPQDNVAFADGHASFSLNFDDTGYPPQLAYSSTTFVEAAANDGSVVTEISVTLQYGEFSSSVAIDSADVTNLPAGLSVDLVRDSATELTLSLSGQAVAHFQDIDNVAIAFDAADFVQGEFTELVNNDQLFTIDFKGLDPVALSSLRSDPGDAGLVLDGSSYISMSGESVSAAGDVNGDGYDDVIIGAPFADANSEDAVSGDQLSNIDNFNSGAAYVVYGSASGGFVDLKDLEATSALGFVINGIAEEDDSGRSVSGGGDVNGDGFDDLIIGVPLDDTNATDSGAVYVVFGTGSATNVELSEVADGVGGFVIYGGTEIDNVGTAVCNAGDVNGDGLDDIVIGAARYDDVNATNSGRSYVVFGKEDGTVVSLSAIESNSNNGGFVINGAAAGDGLGASVSTAGDINGDGLADIIVGADGYNAAVSDEESISNVGASYVIYGKTTGSEVDVSSLESQGLQITGINASDYSGCSVSAAGDVNGDGIADLIIGAKYADPGNQSGSGQSYVVFGAQDNSSINLSDVAQGTGGFAINGFEASAHSGYAVSGVGDVNGDGYDDVLIGAPESDSGGNNAGMAYLVFGKDDTAAIELSSIVLGEGGFAINGENGGGHTGFAVSAAGDVNGDGFADLLVGAHEYNSKTGAGYVIFGGAGTVATVGTAAANTLNGTTAVDQFIGGLGNDVLVGNGGADVLRGGAGDDVLAISDALFAVVDGGSGNDTLRLDSPVEIDFTALSDLKITDIEVIDMANDGGNSSLSLNIADVLSFLNSQGSDFHLAIEGSSGDSVDLLNATAGYSGTWSHGSGDEYAYTVSGIGVLGVVEIASAVAVAIVA
jgi:hypothetical protein